MDKSSVNMSREHLILRVGRNDEAPIESKVMITNMKLRLTAQKGDNHRIGGSCEQALKACVHSLSLGQRIPGGRHVEDDVVTHRNLRVLCWDKRVRGQLRGIDPQDTPVPSAIGMGSGELDQPICGQIRRIVVTGGNPGQRTRRAADSD